VFIETGEIYFVEKEKPGAMTDTRAFIYWGKKVFQFLKSDHIRFSLK